MISVSRITNYSSSSFPFAKTRVSRERNAEYSYFLMIFYSPIDKRAPRDGNRIPNFRDLTNNLHVPVGFDRE